MKYDELQTISYIIVSLYIFFSLRKKCKLSTVLVSIVVINVGITIFARLFWAIENYKGFLNGSLGLKDVFLLRLSLFKIIGVLIGAVVGTIILTKIYKKDKKYIVNASTEAMFLGAGYTKIVCTIVGCCLGRKLATPLFGIYARHMTALYEAIVWFIGFILLHLLKKKIKVDSTRISIIVLYYIFIRMFILEWLYNNGIFMGSMTSRIIYFIVIAICISVILINRKKKQVNENNESFSEIQKES